MKGNKELTLYIFVKITKSKQCCTCKFCKSKCIYPCLFWERDDHWFKFWSQHIELCNHNIHKF